MPDTKLDKALLPGLSGKNVPMHKGPSFGWAPGTKTADAPKTKTDTFSAEG